MLKASRAGSVRPARSGAGAGRAQPLRISVLIPSWRRPRTLARCLDALERQTRPADELILSVRGEDTGTRALLADRPSPLAIRVATPPEPGVIAALNAGLERADGDIVAITDDDTVPHRDWLGRIEARFVEDRELGGLGGKDRIMEGGVEPADAPERVVGRVRWFGRVVGNHHLGFGEIREVDILKGANMALRRDAVATFRLDPAMRGEGAEDNWEIDLSLALRAAGWRLMYDPAVLVDHHREARLGSQRGEQMSAQDRYDSVHNQAYALLKRLPLGRRLMTLTYELLVGTRANPGPLLGLVLLASGQPPGEVAGRMRIATTARLGAFRTWWRWRCSVHRD